MYFLQKLTLAVFLACFFMLASARELPALATEDLHESTLESRLAAGLLSGDGSGGGGGGLLDCWNALMELRSCTNEIVLFFLNGETYLTLDCCRAIRVITRYCWPPMLSSLGFTPQEGDVLRGYCDAEVAAGISTPPSLAPTTPAALTA